MSVFQGATATHPYCPRCADASQLSHRQIVLL